MTDLIYEQFAKNYLNELLSPYVQVEIDRQVIMKREAPKEEDPYREFAKGFFSTMLSPYGTVEINKELPPPEPEHIPVYCTTKANTQITDELGLLKKFINKNALFYPIFHEVEGYDIRHCLYVTLTLFQEYDAREEYYAAEFKNFLEENRNYVDKFKEEDEDEDDEYDKEDYAYQVAKDTWISDIYHPRSWVLIPTADESLLDGFRADPSEEWVKGVYFLGAMFKTQIIVVDKLPKTYETLWLRLLTKGKVLLEAIDELEALPQTHVLRFKALNALMGLYTNLQASQDLDAEDQELVARLSQIYRQQTN
jgi:hypothetical protein